MAEKPSDPSDIRTHSQDLVQLVVGYVKQETIEPVRGLGRFLGFGLAGSALFAIGQLMFLLGVLRLLQTETGDVFDGRLSFLPYVLTLIGCAAVAALVMSRTKTKPANTKEG